MRAPDDSGPRPGSRRGPADLHTGHARSGSSSHGQGAPRAYVTVLPPAGRRLLTWISYRCPHCGGTHLGRIGDPAALEGIRRGGCGRLVDLVRGIGDG